MHFHLEKKKAIFAGQLLHSPEPWEFQFCCSHWWKNIPRGGGSFRQGEEVWCALGIPPLPQNPSWFFIPSSVNKTASTTPSQPLFIARSELRSDVGTQNLIFKYYSWSRIPDWEKKGIKEFLWCHSQGQFPSLNLPFPLKPAPAGISGQHSGHPEVIIYIFPSLCIAGKSQRQDFFLPTSHFWWINPSHSPKNCFSMRWKSWNYLSLGWKSGITTSDSPAAPRVWGWREMPPPVPSDPWFLLFSGEQW